LSNTVFLRALKAGLTVIVLIAAASYIQPGKIISSLFAIRPANLGVALVLLIPNLGLQQMKWLTLLRRIDRRATAEAAWHSLLAGFPLGLATPGRWGELGRAIFLPAYPKLTIAALAAIDKLANFVVVMTLGAIGVAVFVRAGFLPALPFSSMLVLTAAILPVVGFFLSPLILKKIIKRRAATEQSPAWISLLMSFDVKTLLAIWGMSFLFVLLFCAQLLILVAGLHAIDVVHGFAAAASTFFAQSLLPFSIGDLGVREGAAAFFFSKTGVAPHAAFSAALLLFVINMLLPSMLGLFLLWKNPSKPR